MTPSASMPVGELEAGRRFWLEVPQEQLDYAELLVGVTALV